MNLVKSKQRVADHGEVFTPPWMVEAMLDLVKPQPEQLPPEEDIKKLERRVKAEDKKIEKQSGKLPGS